MTARTAPQQPGTPTWLDVWTSDIPGTARFFRDLLGYDGEPEVTEQTQHVVLTHGGRAVMGLGPALPDTEHDVAVVYLATDDCATAVARARELGASVVIEPMAVPGTGTFAALHDPAGVLTALWQAGGVVGYGAVDEPGMPCWQDVITPDLEATTGFLAGLFGYAFTQEMGPDNPVGRLGEDQHFSAGTTGEHSEPGWVTYLLVDDIDVAIERAVALGGTCPTGARPLPFGRWAHLTTPGGAAFGLFETTPEETR